VNSQQKFFILFFTILLTIATHEKSKAQQTIFNVPTTDVLEKGKIYVELDAAFKTNDSQTVNKTKTRCCSC